MLLFNIKLLLFFLKILQYLSRSINQQFKVVYAFIMFYFPLSSTFASAAAASDQVHI